VAVAYRIQSRQTVYATVGRGFKAGGFNPASPAGSESYGEEHTWNVEGGVKTAWAGGRVTPTRPLLIDWDD
jgi:iron complex outermembrane receptor protein